MASWRIPSDALDGSGCGASTRARRFGKASLCREGFERKSARGCRFPLRYPDSAASIYLMNSAASLEVANNILAQLGGHRFVVMTGATQVYGSADALQFALPARSAKGIAKVRIVLDPSDTYTVTFYKKTRDRFAPGIPVAELGMVYAEANCAKSSRRTPGCTLAFDEEKAQGDVDSPCAIRTTRLVCPHERQASRATRLDRTS